MDVRNDMILFEDRPVKIRGCDHPNCSEAGDFRAPKNRDLHQYYWFCLEHVRQYNKAWDYFAGMSPTAIEAHIRNASVWERPSWPLGDWQKREQNLRDKINEEFFGGEVNSPHTEETTQPLAAGEREALVLLDLLPPVTFGDIKAQYRILVKRFHPDANGGSRDAEEKFKAINQAFAILKQIYSFGDGD